MTKTFNFTSDWFSSNIPRFTKHLNELKQKQNINFLEIGSWEGRSACWLLDNILTDDTATLTCVDTWLGSDEAAHNDQREKVWGTFCSNMQNYPNHKIVIKRGLSREKLKELPLLEYDFIYVDGSHTTRDTLGDAVLAFDLLKQGGIMIFDDYLWGQDSVQMGFMSPLHCPKLGIDAFLTCYQEDYMLLEMAYQVVIKKK